MASFPFLFVANWKAQKTYGQAQEFLTNHTARLANLMIEVHAQLVICPSAESLPLAHTHIKKDPVSIGAQSCAPALTGPFTGQIPILSLVELHCSYCIIGHSETRAYGEPDTAIATKAALLLDQSITPIICVGESQSDYEKGKAAQIVESQLTPLFKQLKPKTGTCLIAYEPQWAIGSGKMAPVAHIQAMNELIAQLTTAHLPTLTCSILYGGSVSPETIANLRSLKKNNPALAGLLIGGASLEVESLTNLIRLWYV